MNQVCVHLVKRIVITTTESRSTSSKETVGGHVYGQTFNRYTVQNEGRTVIEVSVQHPRSLYKGISLCIRGVGFAEDVVLEPHACDVSESTIICNDPSCSWVKNRLRDAVLKNQFQVGCCHVLYNRNGVVKWKNFTNKHIGHLFRRFSRCCGQPMEIRTQATAIGNGHNGSVYFIIALSIRNS